MVRRHARKPKRKHSKREKPLTASTDLYLNRSSRCLRSTSGGLAMAARTSVPLASACATSACVVALDEFFEVRVSDLTEVAWSVGSVYATVLERAHRLVAQQYELYNNTIMPALARQNIVIINHAQRTAEQRAWLRDYVGVKSNP